MINRIWNTHIEDDDLGNKRLIYTDNEDVEWVEEQFAAQIGGYITQLIKKKDSISFIKKNKTNK